MSVNAVGGGWGGEAFDNIQYLFVIVKISQRNRNRVESPHIDKENPQKDIIWLILYFMVKDWLLAS